MANGKDDAWGFLIVWEFQVRPAMAGRFEEVYGPKGDWARFFQRDKGYLGTDLNRDLKNPHRYLTLDFWTSREAYQAFRQQNLTEYEAIDERCEVLTERELEVGKFERLQ